MCCTFNPYCRYDSSLNVRKNTFQSLEGSAYQCPQVESTCQVRNIPSEQQTVSFFWILTKGFTFLKRFNRQFEMLLDMCIVQHAQTKSVFTFQPTKTLISTTVKSAKPALTCSVLQLRTKNQQYLHLVEMVHIVLIETCRDYEKEKVSRFLMKYIRQPQSSTPEPVLEIAK